jgi:hypothetical protein
MTDLRECSFPLVPDTSCFVCPWDFFSRECVCTRCLHAFFVCLHVCISLHTCLCVCAIASLCCPFYSSVYTTRVHACVCICVDVHVGIHACVFAWLPYITRVASACMYAQVPLCPSVCLCARMQDHTYTFSATSSTSQIYTTGPTAQQTNIWLKFPQTLFRSNLGLPGFSCRQVGMPF